MTGIIQIINNFERNSKYMQIVLPLSYCKKKNVETNEAMTNLMSTTFTLKNLGFTDVL